MYSATSIRRNAVLVSAIAFAVLVVNPEPACAAAAEVIAKAGTIELSSAEVRSLVIALPEASRAAIAADPKVLEQYVRNELVRRSVATEVRTAGFERDLEVVKQLDRLKDEALMRLWIANKAKPPASFPSDDEVKAAYESNKAAFAAPAEYRISQIFISAPNGADAAQVSAALTKAADLGKKVTTGDFAALARTSSDHAESAAKGGDLGFLPENRLLPEVAAAVRTLPVGQTVGPVKTAQGLHYLKLTEKKVGAVPELATIKSSIVTAMRDTRAQQLEQAYLNDLGSRLGISINQIELAKLQPLLK
jgi:PPIC-type PPIASE domain